MEPLQYARINGEAEEELYLYSDGDVHFLSSFKLGTIFLLVMKTLSLLDEQPSSAKDYDNTVKNVFMDSEKTQELYDCYLKQLYEDMYDEKDDKIWRLHETMLSTVNNYVVLCMDKPEYYNKENFFLMTSTVVSDFSPPVLITNPLTFFSVPPTEFYQKKDCSDLEYMFQNKEAYTPTFMYNARLLVHICLATLHELISSGFSIKKCEQCGQWFIEITKNSKYCSEHCKETAKKEKASKRLKEEEVARLLKNRRQYFVNVENFNENGEKSKELKAFNLAVKEWRKEIKEGNLAEDEFIDWIKSTYKRGPRPRKKE